MSLSPNTPAESEKMIGDAGTGSRKRRKVEQAEQQNGIAVNGISKEERRLAKKTRRAASRAETGADEAGSGNTSR